MLKQFANLAEVLDYYKSEEKCRDTGIGQKASWFLLCRVREMLRNKTVEMLDEVVQTDETYVGSKFENMTRAKRKAWQESGKDNKTPVMGFVASNGKARLSVIGK